MYKSIQSTVYISDTESTRYSFLQFEVFLDTLLKKKITSIKNTNLTAMIQQFQAFTEYLLCSRGQEPKDK